MTKETSLTVKENSFPAFSGDEATVAFDILRENFQGKAPSPTDFDSIRVPSGGGLSFSVPTLDGDAEEKELIGVIVGFFDSRAYWKDDFGGDSGPPDCASHDNETGVGQPGGQCDVCPLAQFGSASKGNSQACKSMRTLFFLEKGKYLPITIVAPPTSIKAVKKYFLRLASSGLRFSSVVTKISLIPEKNNSGIKYSSLQMSRESNLSPLESGNAKSYSLLLRGEG